jgi:chloramphenicol-sensitive protein RarD
VREVRRAGPVGGTALVFGADPRCPARESRCHSLHVVPNCGGRTDPLGRMSESGRAEASGERFEADERSRVLGGVWLAAGAYLLWGVLPIYWKALDHVPAEEILAHRMVWSLAVVAGLLALQGRWGWIRIVLARPKVLLAFTASALLLAVNWFLYIWAVNAGFIVETSLGYFINPLVNVALGVLFLGERLRRGQALALSLAAFAVVFLTFQYGAVPWIALALGTSFGLYGLIRKTAPLGSLDGLALETTIVFAPAALYLFHLGSAGRLAFGQVDGSTTALLVLSGVVTAAPLILFASAARRIPLALLGVMQYVAPSLQFLIGVFIYGETVGPARLAGFMLVWLALAVYTAEGLRHRRLTVRMTIGGVSPP